MALDKSNNCPIMNSNTRSNVRSVSASRRGRRTRRTRSGGHHEHHELHRIRRDEPNTSPGGRNVGSHGYGSGPRDTPGLPQAVDQAEPTGQPRFSRHGRGAEPGAHRCASRWVEELSWRGFRDGRGSAPYGRNGCSSDPRDGWSSRRPGRERSSPCTGGRRCPWCPARGPALTRSCHQ